MAKKYKLTWHKTTKRWRKRYRGRDYYFPFGTAKSDEDGYKQALEAWEHLKGELDGSHQKESKRAIELRERILQWYVDSVGRDAFDLPPVEYKKWDYVLEEEIGHELGVIELNTEKMKPLSLAQLQVHIDPIFGQSEDVKQVWKERLPNLMETSGGHVKQNKVFMTASRHIDTFVSLQKMRAKSGQISVAHFQTVMARFQTIRHFLGDTTAKQIIGPTFPALHAHLLKQISQEKISPIYARHLMSEFRKFVKWLYVEEIIDVLPWVLMSDSRQFIFYVTPKAIVTFDVSELHQLLTNASERTRLYLLLMMNTGMTQNDISELGKTDVDWKRGTITRKRTKTQRHEAVPTVKYKLWKPTLDLLLKHRSDDKERVLVNENGQPLRNRRMRPNGTTTNFDNIRKAYDRLTKKLKIKKPKTLKQIRNTSTSILETHDTFARYAPHFLGHAPQSISEIHYIKPSEEQFDRAIQWLGEQYKIGDLDLDHSAIKSAPTKKVTN